MNSLAYEKLPIFKSKFATNTHIQMTLKNLRVVINNQLLVPFNNNLHEAIKFRYARFTSGSKGLETKPIETWDVGLHDKAIKVWVCDITMKDKMTKNKSSRNMAFLFMVNLFSNEAKIKTQNNKMTTLPT
jgi:hypothetical protein